LELASFRVLHGTTDTSRRETAVEPRSSKHGHGRLVLTNTRRPWHGVPGCVCGDNYQGPDDCTPVDCLRSCGRTTSTTAQLLTACSRGRRTVRSCAVVRSAFSETVPVCATSIKMNSAQQAEDQRTPVNVMQRKRWKTQIATIKKQLAGNFSSWTSPKSFTFPIFPTDIGCKPNVNKNARELTWPIYWLDPVILAHGPLRCRLFTYVNEAFIDWQAAAVGIW